MQMFSPQNTEPYRIQLVEYNKQNADRDPLQVPYMFIAYLKNDRGSSCNADSGQRHPNTH